MAYTSYKPDVPIEIAGMEQFACEAEARDGHSRSGQGARLMPGGADGVCADAVEAALQQLPAGLRGGAGVRGFQAGIEAGQRMLGNRAFVRRVEALQSRGQDAAAPDPAAPLQMMPKKKKKQEAAGTGAGPGMAAQGGDAGAGPDDGAPELVAVKPQAQGPLPQAEPVAGQGAVGGGKKKKKSRVQVALNALRGEGVAAFGAYIEAEIGEAALLRTLVERIMRAQDLAGVSKEALRVVEARLRLLDPLLPAPAFAGVNLSAEPAPLLARGAGSRASRGAGREEPEIAPVKARLKPRERELLDACTRGDVGKFRLFTRNVNVDINVADKFGTLLVNAAFEGHEIIVRELLLMRGINVNLAQQLGATPLYVAAQQGHVKIVEMLLAESGIKVNLSTSDGATPLFIAAQCGHEAVVKLLLAAPGVDVNLRTMDGGTPLMVAIEREHVEVAKLLLAAPGTEIDARMLDGTTALYNAAEKNFPGIVEELVRRGANVNLAVRDGAPPLGIAAYRGNDEIVRKLLAAAGVEVDKPNEDGITPLSAAADGGYQDIVGLLLDNGADPNRSNPMGITPLHRACLYGYTRIVELLLHAGANAELEMNDPEVSTRTPYSFAQLAGHWPIMRLLENHRKAGAQQASLALATPAGAAQAASLTSPAAGENRDGAGRQAPGNRATASPETPGQTGPAGIPAAPPTPLAQAQDGLRQQVLGKLRDDSLDPRDGILLLQDVNAVNDLDGLCTLHNRLAHIERQKLRARRRRRRGGLSRGREAAPGRAPATAPEFTLREKTGLDAERVEAEIKRFLDQAYHRFVSQAVNDMEFGRGKRTAGYPDLWHASAGIPGVGSCSVFYYLDAERNRIRIVGIGRHAGRAEYHMDYVSGALGGVGRVLRIA